MSEALKERITRSSASTVACRALAVALSSSVGSQPPSFIFFVARSMLLTKLNNLNAATAVSCALATFLERPYGNTYFFEQKDFMRAVSVSLSSNIYGSSQSASVESLPWMPKRHDF